MRAPRWSPHDGRQHFITGGQEPCRFAWPPQFHFSYERIMNMDSTEAQACALAYEHGATIRALADQYGTTPAVMRAELRRLRVTFRNGPLEIPPSRPRLQGRPQAKAGR
jgi:hypothetical protein